MSLTIRSEPVKSKDLKPGDLFSTVGPLYWGQSFSSIGEKVYIRTEHALYPEANDADLTVYRLTIEKGHSSEHLAKCHHCHWEGAVENLVVLDNSDVKVCPVCFQSDEIETKEE